MQLSVSSSCGLFTLWSLGSLAWRREDDGEDVADSAKRCVGHEEVLAIAAVFCEAVGFRHAHSVQTMLVPRFENGTPAVMPKSF